MTAPAIPPRVYRLRWRFDFVDGKTKRGIWNGTSNNPEDSASRVSKVGLIRASIEAEDLGNHQMTTLVEVDGPDYASAQWEALARAPAMVNLRVPQARLRTHISGLSIKTRTELISAWVDGRVTRRALTDQEKLFKLEEHS